MHLRGWVCFWGWQLESLGCEETGLTRKPTCVPSNAVRPFARCNCISSQADLSVYFAGVLPQHQLITLDLFFADFVQLFASPR